MRVAWFSALPISEAYSDLRSAYFSKHVLPLIKDKVELELFHNSFEPYEDYSCHHYLAAFKRHEEKPFDVFFYQLEDSPLCQFARVHALLKPGVVYFHDFVFTSFGPEPILNSPWKIIQGKFAGVDVAWPKRDQKHYQDGPLAKREGTFAPIALFSNPAQHTQFKDLHLDSLADTSSSYFLPLPVSQDGKLVAPRMGKVRIGFCGSPRIEHRAHKLLSALSQMHEDCELMWMVRDKDRSHAENLVAEFDIGAVSMVTDYGPAVWQDLTQSFDIAVHLAFSVYEQNDPYLGMSLMAGLPCLVTDFGPSQALPDNVVFKIQPGDSEAFQIQRVLEALNARQVAWNSQAARAFAVERYHVAAISHDLVSTFERHESDLRTLSLKWTEFEQSAKAELLREARAVANAESSGIRYKNLNINRLPDDNFVFNQICEPVFKELGWL
ncbi:MAG: glycosyltransferase [Bdellovibrionales bacterium]|nr:glycosyltransferase [Bdellovibrionales bacterium]